MAAKMAMMAITTSNSINVKPCFFIKLPRPSKQTRIIQPSMIGAKTYQKIE
jgi:hypothetical protein